MTNCQDGNSPEFQARLDQRRQKRMARIDTMAPELRELVHVYGLTVVDTLIGAGVTKPKLIRHVVESILDEFSPTRGSAASQGTRVNRREQ